MSVSSRLRASALALTLSLALGTALGAGALAAAPASAATAQATTSTVSMPSSVAAKKLTSATPKISGTAKVGNLLTVKTGTWTKGTKLTFQWYANGKAITGAKLSKYRVTESVVGKNITVTVTGTKSGYAKKSVTSAATAKVPAVKKPATPTTYTPAKGSWNCPSWAPIKGNASSMIYHVPGGRYYAKTQPEQCFATTTAAVRAGYRASKA